MKRPYITAGTTLVVFAGGVAAHAYLHPFDPKKEHDEPHGIYMRVLQSTESLTSVGSGMPPLTISVKDDVGVTEEFKLA